MMQQTNVTVTVCCCVVYFECIKPYRSDLFKSASRQGLADESRISYSTHTQQTSHRVESHSLSTDIVDLGVSSSHVSLCVVIGEMNGNNKDDDGHGI